MVITTNHSSSSLYGFCRNFFNIPIFSMRHRKYSSGLSNTFVLALTFLTSGVLYLEGIPFLKQVFGTYAPRNPYDGMPYEEGTAAWIAGMQNENHYKLQLLSSIVRAVIPIYFDEYTKTGLVYFYWIFWATILPLFFLLSFQGLCTQ